MFELIGQGFSFLKCLIYILLYCTWDIIKIDYVANKWSYRQSRKKNKNFLKPNDNEEIRYQFVEHSKGSPSKESQSNKDYIKKEEKDKSKT